ncbi:C40 family peptidase [Dokdonia sp. Hel_I_53]|uniref:C40 family peptidase n=1 Tax=Dokdonia sp. Hel_I_53 TaxID=1566287 RepID=UPI00119C0493|nr:C40 family peptidase [Dokdonia sp. Hel_I_53]TVZ51457.1 SH3 domain-containing protein [Dokdonia sp. Hel_I_53]
MRYGICQLSIVPMRAEPSDRSELVNQVLYGEHFKVVELRKNWSRVKLSHDKYEGWIDNKQYIEITEDEYAFAKAKPLQLVTDPVQFVTTNKKELLTIVLGASVGNLNILKATYDGDFQSDKKQKKHLIETALLYMKSPYLWGGRTIFGIDCSGFTQMVYRLNGYFLKRDASQQASQGEALSFIEESEPGDLAFFDNAEGLITHVGIIMENNYIIHAHGEVRIDRLDHSGIYNPHTRSHTHKLRVIKKII